MKDDRVYKFPLLPPGLGNPQNSGASIIPLRDGRLFMAYSYTYGEGGDWAPTRIAACFSEDDGITWTRENLILVENEARLGTGAASLVRLTSGPIALFYIVINSGTDSLPYMRISKDEGRTWSEQVRVAPQDGYYTVNSDRVIQLSSGRLVVPASFPPGFKKSSSSMKEDKDFDVFALPYRSTCFLSDDEGTSWRQSQTVLENPWQSKTGLEEPGVVVLKDDSLLLYMRTNMGGQFFSYSQDGGEIWTPAVPSSLIGPCSPATIKRIPSTGDLLAIWNTPSEACTRPLPRCTLSAAISKDEGRVWQNIKTLEYDPDASYCYLSLIFVKNTAVMTYSHRHNYSFEGEMLKLAVVDVDWLYD